MQEKVIWTIGHSTHTIDEFITLLNSFGIQLVADIRSYPGSRRYPHFNKELLNVTLAKSQIEYIHLKDLGGRRKSKPDSLNDGWRHEAFRGYADYMETDFFKYYIKELESLALQMKTVFMCSEALWWRCHRSLVSDWLKLHGWKVIHIMNVGKSEEHPYTQPARIVDGKLIYSKEYFMIDYQYLNSKLLFVGINPHEGSFNRGVPFSNNKMFWYLLSRAGIISESIDELRDDKRLKEIYEEKFNHVYHLGLVNIIDRPTSDVTLIEKGEEVPGVERLTSIIRNHKPPLVCFVGKVTYQKFSGLKNVSFGWQPDLYESKMYVMHFPLRGEASVRVKELEEIASYALLS